MTVVVNNVMMRYCTSWPTFDDTLAVLIHPLRAVTGRELQCGNRRQDTART